VTSSKHCHNFRRHNHEWARIVSSSSSQGKQCIITVNSQHVFGDGLLPDICTWCQRYTRTLQHRGRLSHTLPMNRLNSLLRRYVNLRSLSVRTCGLEKIVGYTVCGDIQQMVYPLYRRRQSVEHLQRVRHSRNGLLTAQWKASPAGLHHPASKRTNWTQCEWSSEHRCALSQFSVLETLQHHCYFKLTVI